MSQFIQLKSPYRISELDLDRIATKVHNRKNKLIVKLYYKPNRKTHTDYLFQTPEILLKNNIKYNKKGYYELEAPFLGKKQKSINLYGKFIEELENKIIEIIKKNKDWFTDKNIKFKSIIRFPNKNDELYKLLRLKINSDTLIKKSGKNIDISSLKKDYYIKCILKVSFIYIKDSFVTLNIYPVIIDLRNKIEDLQFASSESISSELTTESETESESEDKQKIQSQLEDDNKQVQLESLDEYKSSMLEIPKELRDDCGTSEMFQESTNNKQVSEDDKQISEDDKQISEDDEQISEDDKQVSEDDKQIIENKNEILLKDSNIDTDTSIITNLNSDRILESYGTNIHIRDIDLDVSEESNNSDYSEEIHSDEISGWEESLI